MVNKQTTMEQTFTKARTTANACENLTAARSAKGGLSFQIGEGTADLINN